MADNYSSRNGSEVEDEWMLVDMGENGPIAVEESQVVGNDNIVEDGISMKTHYIYDDKGTPVKDLFQDLPKMMSRRPKAVLLILSTRQTLETHTDMDFPGLISQVHYQVKAADKTSDDLAERAKELIEKAGIKSARQEHSVRGGDNGSGTHSMPLFYNYVSDHIPVCQLSVQLKRDGAFHYNLGRALAALKHEDVLIVGVGVRNNVGLSSRPSHLWAKAFDKWLSDRLLNNRFEEIVQFETRIPHASNNLRLAERLYPLLVALGAAGEGAIAERVNDDGWAFCSHS